MADQQVDLFLDQLVDAPIKDERSLMEFPFFSLQKRPRTEPLTYDDGVVQITIEPGSNGIATIWDKDLLIYLASLINEKIEKGEHVDRTMQFHAYDFMRVTGRGTGKRAYELFLDALHRLRSTNIQTTIAAGGDIERRGFGWIEDWRVLERTNSQGKKAMAGVEVTLNRWMFNSIVQDRRVLTINRNYFGLTMGLERRLYELARKHVGSQTEWFISLSRLAEKCGTVGSLRKFKYRIVEISKRANIPDYHLELVDSDTAKTPFRTKGQPLVRFTPLKVASEIGVKEKPKPKQTSSAQETGEPGRVSIHTYEKAKELFPGYNIDFLEDRWIGWTASKGTVLKAPDKAFLAWCRTYTQNNPI